MEDILDLEKFIKLNTEIFWHEEYLKTKDFKLNLFKFQDNSLYYVVAYCESYSTCGLFYKYNTETYKKYYNTLLSFEGMVFRLLEYSDYYFALELL